MDRVDFITANAAARQAIGRALDGHVTARQLRVLLAVLHHTVFWSKLADQVTLGQLADSASISGKDVRERDKSVADDLRHLAHLGAVIYQPGKGRGRASTIALPPPPENGGQPIPLFPSLNGGQPIPVNGNGKGGSTRPEKGGESAPKRGVNSPPYPRSNSKNTSKGRQSRPAPFPDGAGWAGHPGGKVDLT